MRVPVFHQPKTAGVARAGSPNCACHKRHVGSLETSAPFSMGFPVQKVCHP